VLLPGAMAMPPGESKDEPPAEDAAPTVPTREGISVPRSIQVIELSLIWATESVPESRAVPSVALVAAMKRSRKPAGSSWEKKITARPSGVAVAAMPARVSRPRAVRLMGKAPGSSGLSSATQPKRGASVGSA
jgi:hypothetical protein